jgi:uncharacterized protein (DUF2336 family)
MSIVQPENGLPERRVITADSFRALKLRLNGGKRGPVPAVSSEIAPVEVPPIDPDRYFGPSAESIETLHEPSVVVAQAPIEEMPAAEAEVPAEAVDLPQSAPPQPDPLQFEPETIEVLAPPPPEFELLATAVEPFAEVVETVNWEPPLEEAMVAEEPAEIGIAPAFNSATIEPAAIIPEHSSDGTFVERRVLEKPQAEDPEAGQRALELLDIMAVPTAGSLPQERALANDTLLRLIPRMPLKSLRHLAERVCLMEAPSEMLVRRLINDPRIEVSGPLLENAMAINDSDLIAVASANNPPKLRLMARRRVISPALSEALIQSNHVETLLNLVRNEGASFSIESMWRLTRFAAAHPVLQAPLVTRQDTPSPIAFQLFWRLPSELRRYVLSRFLTDSETITKILTMNMEGEGTEPKFADLSLLSRLEEATPGEAGEIYSRLTHVSEATGARIADDPGGEALTVALKAAGLTRAQFADIVGRRDDAEDLKAIFETLSFNKARVLLTYWDWATQRTGPYARTAAA